MAGLKLSPEDIEELRAAHRSVCDKREADRLKAIIHLGSGWTEQEVAEALLLDADTLRRFVKRYHEGGVERLLTFEYRGGIAKLTAEQEAQLNEHLSQQIYLRAADITAYIQTTFAVTYSVNGVTDLLHRMGYVYKKPKVVPGKADLQKQRRFLAKYRKLRKNKGQTNPVYFMDGVHLQHNTVGAHGWIKRGVAKTIASNTNRQRLNINGAIHIDSLKTVTRTDPSVNAQSTVALLQEIQRKHRKAKAIHVICDNARYYQSRIVKAFVQTSKIKLMFLPPYSPNLNLIERLWKYTRKQILYNKYYNTFAEFKSQCQAFFESLHEHRETLSTLLRENFEIIRPDTP